MANRTFFHLSAKFGCPVACQNFLLLATAHDCETGLIGANIENVRHNALSMVVSILLSTPVEKRNLLKSLSGCQTQFQRQNPLWVPMYDVEISQLFGICQMRGVKRRLLHQHENPFFSHSPHVSTRTSCSSMDLMGVSECTTSN